MSYEIKPNNGATKKRKRLGCGRGSGLGKTSGKGHKGQRSRSGKNRPYVGFEGGQMPLYRRVPKRGFNRTGEYYAIVNLYQLAKLDDGSNVNSEELCKIGLIKKVDKEFPKLKILGNGDIDKKINVEVNKISATAKEKIEKAGGTVKLIEG